MINDTKENRIEYHNKYALEHSEPEKQMNNSLSSHNMVKQ